MPIKICVQNCLLSGCYFWWNWHSWKRKASILLYNICAHTKQITVVNWNGRPFGHSIVFMAQLLKTTPLSANSFTHHHTVRWYSYKISYYQLSYSHTHSWAQRKLSPLKGQCHEIFWHFFISWIEAIWAPDKQAKMVLLKNSFSRRYSNLKFEKIDSAQANTARSRIFFQS